MNCVVVRKKVSYSWLRDGINAYHAELFHGTLTNRNVDDNNLGDNLSLPLHLNKDVYECKFIIQPRRNLVLPERAKRRLTSIPGMDFFQIVFEKLFFSPFPKGDLSVGPEDFRDLKRWLDEFDHVEGLRSEIENFYELVIPSHERLSKQFTHLQTVEFNLESWRKASLQLSVEMLSKYPAIWSPEGIVLREDVFHRIEDFFCWDYFHKGQFTLK